MENKKLYLYEFQPNETGYDSFFVMSSNKKEAILSINKRRNGSVDDFSYEKYKHKYKVKRFGLNIARVNDNC